MVCSFSIPIVTLVALIVLMIFVILLNLIFFWLPLLKICFPVPKVRWLMSGARDQLGGGIAFPFRIGPDGRVATSGGARNVRELIEVVLRTRHGERVRLPAFGAGLDELRSEPNTPATRREIEDADHARAQRVGAARAARVGRGGRRPRRPRGGGRHRPLPARRRPRLDADRRRGPARRADRHGDHATPARRPQLRRARRRRAARAIPAHTPEWTNFHHADVGVTLVELFAFLAESAIYRANLVPERNRRAFVELLGVPRAPGRPGAGHRHADPAAVRRAGAGADGARGVRRLGAVPAHERARRAARRGARRRARGARSSPPAPSSSRATSACTSSPAARTWSARSRRSTGRCRSAPKGGPTPLARHRRPLRLDRAARAGGDRQDDERRRGAARDRGADPVDRRRRGAVGPGRRRRARRVQPRRAARRRRSTAELPRTGAGASLRDGRPHVEWATAPALAEHDLLADPGVLHVTLPGLARAAGRARRRPARGGRRRAPARPAGPRARGPRRDLAAPARAREQQRADGLGRRQRRDGLPARRT